MASYSVNETQELIESGEILELINQFNEKFPLKQTDLKDLIKHKPEQQRDAVFSKHHNEASTTHPKTSRIVPPCSSVTPEIRNFRQKLPVYHLRSQILDAIENKPVTLVTGGTGCGKTTQVPQFLLEKAVSENKPIRILCTQPRRLPAIAISKRVAKERGENLGETVGFQIRLEQKTSPRTALIYCTSGVLLRKLAYDDSAEEATHIILDEIHERETNTDYLLICLRQALLKRNDLKLVLMSATMEGNIQTFMRYFENKIGRIDIPSRIYPIDCYHLSEVLLLTKYMPSTECGMFDPTKLPAAPPGSGSDSFGNGGFSNSRTDLSSQRTFVPTQMGNQQRNSSANYSFTGNGLAFIQHTINASTSIELTNNRNLNNRMFGQFTNETQVQTSVQIQERKMKIGGFGSRTRGRTLEQDLQQHIRRLFPDRPEVFTPNYMPKFKEALGQFQQRLLVDAYYDAGGRQWRDSVDKELVVRTVKYLMDCPLQGGILVFLPGFEEINDIHGRILNLYQNAQFRTEPVVHTLHSQLNSNTQQKVFDRVDKGKRKIVLSTNIAEASLTIDDIVFVIDSGKAKEKGYNHQTRVARLICRSIAKSNAVQRKGRAGRCQPGFCFRLYTHDDFDQMLATQVPEIQRTAIHDVCLNAKMFAPGGMSVKDFLKQAPDPPDADTLTRSMEFLEQLGALYTSPASEELPPPQLLPERELSPAELAMRRAGDRPHRGMHYGMLSRGRHHNLSPSYPIIEDWSIQREPEITELGRLIAHLPLEPQLARLLLSGIALKCFSPVLTLVAAVSYRDPFLLTIGGEEARQAAITIRDDFSRMDYSDHLMLIRACCRYEDESNLWLKEKFCQRYFMNEQSMKMINGIKNQLIYELKRLHLLPPDMFNGEYPSANIWSHSWPMIQAAICFGAYPNIGYCRMSQSRSKYNKIRTNVGKFAHFHPSSSLRRQVQSEERRAESLKKFKGVFDPDLNYLVFQEVISTDEMDDNYALKTVTAVPQLAVCLFAGPIRMDAQCLDHFELVDTDGKLRQKRLEKQEERIKKWHEEQREERRLWQETVRNAQKMVQKRKKESEAQNGWGAANESSNNQMEDETIENALVDEGEEYVPPMFTNNEELLQLDQWFAFRGPFDSLQSLMRFRFRLMSYFTRVMANPGQALSAEDRELLTCTNAVLDAAHQTQRFKPVLDLRRYHSDVGNGHRGRQHISSAARVDPHRHHLSSSHGQRQHISSQPRTFVPSASRSSKSRTLISLLTPKAYHQQEQSGSRDEHMH